MKNICTLLILLAFIGVPVSHAQKGKNKGGGGKNDKVNIKVKTDNVNVKVKTNGKNDKVNIKVKDGKGDNGNHYGQYKNRTVWFFGPGDIYQVRGKGKKERIIIFDQVCIRLTSNIGFLFGLLGDVRIKLDTKKGSMKPERYNKIKVNLDLYDQELKLLEVKKNKIKIRLGQLKIKA